MRPITILLALSIALAGLWTGCDGRDERPNILFIGVESLRCDEMRVYGAEKGAASFLDFLAGKGVVYERAYTAAPWAVPAWASVLTGRSTPEHGVVRADVVFTDDGTRLPSRLKAAGYRTAAFLANPQLTKQRGWAAGFDDFPKPADQGAGDVAAAFETWLDDVRDARPFFAVLGFRDPQIPYQADGELLPSIRQAELPVRQFGPADAIRLMRRWPAPESQEALRFARTLYRAEVDRVDRAVMRVYRRLETKRLLDKTVIVVFGLHGEEFMDHGLMNNGLALNEEVIRVPLVVSGRGRVPEGRRVADVVSLTDLAGLVGAWAELEETASTSLPIPDASAADDVPVSVADRVVAAHTSLGGMDSFALVRRNDKRFLSPDASISDRAFGDRYYRLDVDPGETREASAENPDAVRELDNFMETMPGVVARKAWNLKFSATKVPTLYTGLVATSGSLSGVVKRANRFILQKDGLRTNDFVLVRGPRSVLFAADGADGENGFWFFSEPEDAPISVEARIDGRWAAGDFHAPGLDAPATGPVDISMMVATGAEDAPTSGYRVGMRRVWTLTHPSDSHDGLKPARALFRRLAELVRQRDPDMVERVMRGVEGGAP